MIRRLALLFAALLAFVQLTAQDTEKPISWQVTVRTTSPGNGVAIFKARITPGWHLYSTVMPKTGPKPTVIDLSASKGVEFTSPLKADRAPLDVHDSMFGVDLSWWEADIAFRRTFRITDASVARIAGKISFMGCDNNTCLPPSTVTFDKKVR